MSLQWTFLSFTSLLLCLCRTTFAHENGSKVVRVEEGSDVVLPCSPGNQDLNSVIFDWTKEDPSGRKEVFLYYAGRHYNNGRYGQDPQFRGRVSHFKDELQHGNASIKIQNTKLEDSGYYRCYFPRLEPDQIFRVQLVVGVTPAPDIKTVNIYDRRTQLQCDVRGASPKPKVEWKNSDGEVLHIQRSQVTESEGRYDVTLLTTVDQTGLYHCVVTQEELHHQVHAEIYIYIRGSESSWPGWLISGFVGLVIGVLVTVTAQRIWTVFRERRTNGLFLDHAKELRTCSTSTHIPASSSSDSDESEESCQLELMSEKNVSPVTYNGREMFSDSLSISTVWYWHETKY